MTIRAMVAWGIPGGIVGALATCGGTARPAPEWSGRQPGKESADRIRQLAARLDRLEARLRGGAGERAGMGASGRVSAEQASAAGPPDLVALVEAEIARRSREQEESRRRQRIESGSACVKEFLGQRREWLSERADLSDVKRQEIDRLWAIAEERMSSAFRRFLEWREEQGGGMFTAGQARFQREYERLRAELEAQVLPLLGADQARGFLRDWERNPFEFRGSPRLGWSVRGAWAVEEEVEEILEEMDEADEEDSPPEKNMERE